MTEQRSAAQVAVYVDFDNIVISRYDELHGDHAFRNDNASRPDHTSTVSARLDAAHVNLQAIVEYAASFGDVSIARAYADWSVSVNANYRKDIVGQPIDAVQMFPLSGSKNGADIRLAIDVIDDLSRHDYLSHVVIVAGDSDYVSLAQRCKRLGRVVIGVGATGSVGRYWKSACDVFKFYDQLPGVSQPPQAAAVVAGPPSLLASADLLERAMTLSEDKSTDGWIPASTLKNFMLRLKNTFDEKSEGHSTFTTFLKAHNDVVETKLEGQVTWVRKKPAPPARKRTPAKRPAH